MKVSVISPCRNEANHIDAFLECVLHQECRELELEILVADGLSTDGTAQRLRGWSAKDGRIRVIRNPEGIVSTGLNRAIAAASGDVIVRMDIHTLYAPDYIWQCVQALKNTDAKCVGGPWFAEGKTAKQRAIANAFQSRFGSGGAASRRSDYSGPVDTVYLGAWWRNDLRQIGGFDEELVRNQDDELCLRITRSGGRIWQSAEIRSVYTPRDSLLALWRQFHQYGYWKALVLKKHRIPASPRHLMPFGFVAGMAALLALAPLSPFAGLAFALLAGSYLLAALFFAALANGNGGGTLLCTLAAFCAMHFGYGIGFGRGLFDFLLSGRGARPSMKNLTR
ncbi:MAG TPA: glycosyltransferase family 2 protein [Paucimonas sp.]|nr:glycosyltransferase family 2 protein [Paucimonas sp.]